MWLKWPKSQSNHWFVASGLTRAATIIIERTSRVISIISKAHNSRLRQLNQPRSAWTKPQQPQSLVPSIDSSWLLLTGTYCSATHLWETGNSFINMQHLLTRRHTHVHTQWVTLTQTLGTTGTREKNTHLRGTGRNHNLTRKLFQSGCGLCQSRL